MGGSKGTVGGSGLGLYLRVRDPEPSGFWIGVLLLVLIAIVWAEKKSAPVADPIDAGVDAETQEISRP